MLFDLSMNSFSGGKGQYFIVNVINIINDFLTSLCWLGISILISGHATQMVRCSRLFYQGVHGKTLSRTSFHLNAFLTTDACTLQVKIVRHSGRKTFLPVLLLVSWYFPLLVRYRYSSWNMDFPHTCLYISCFLNRSLNDNHSARKKCSCLHLQKYPVQHGTLKYMLTFLSLC